MGTPGRRRALKALGAAKRRNKARVEHGENPMIEGKEVSKKTFFKKIGGKPKSWKKTKK